jgi:uncharacterized protein (TIGR00255 family)
MIRSMTAFSRQEETTENGVLAWELRSVNHRFSEVSLRLPEELRGLEPAVRERVGQAVKRGKLDATLRYQPRPEADQPLDVDQELARKVAHATREIDGLLYSAAPVSAMDILRWPGVLKTPPQDFERLGETALSLLDQALSELLETRDREGGKLKAIILERCDGMAVQTAKVRQRLPEIMQTLRERLRARLKDLAAELDQERLEQEIALIAHKADVDEELDRLDTHLTEVRRVLDQDEPIGRRLDFLMQELNREANTLGSKSVDADLTRASVELKVLIEQMREQVQNIE